MMYRYNVCDSFGVVVNNVCKLMEVHIYWGGNEILSLMCDAFGKLS